MADFCEKSSDGELINEIEENLTTVTKVTKPNKNEPIQVVYCPKCSWPPEYCEYGQTAAECREWAISNCPEIFGDDELVRKMAAASVGDDKDDDDEEEDEGSGEKKKGKKRGGVGVPRKKVAAAQGETKVIISRIQRQKRKYVTSIVGLDTVPDLKIKDVSKACGKKFASGAAIGETATGAKEIVIQGDVYFEVPQFLMSEFKILASQIFLQDDNNSIQPYA